MNASGNIRRTEDGKYVWAYEINRFKYPKVLFVLLWISGAFFLLLCLLLLFVSVMTRDATPTPPGEILLMCLMLYALCAVVLTVLYYLVTLVRGGKRSVSYEMDSLGITCIKGGLTHRICFSDVRRIKVKRRRCEIRLSAPGTGNRIYTGREDYEEVLGYIKEKTGR